MPFTQNYTPEKVTEIAVADFKTYINYAYQTHNQPDESDCLYAQLQDIDLEVSSISLKPDNPIEFIKKYLNRAEKKYKKGYIFVSLPEQGFLNGLRNCLRAFTRHVARAKVPAICKFAKHLSYQIVYNKKTINFTMKDVTSTADTGWEIKDYLSWLMIWDAKKELKIMYYEDNIKKQCADQGEIERFRQLLAMHEIGHARLHLEDLYKKLISSNKTKVEATPVQESEAWIYASTILGLVRGLRGRINRIMGEFDDAIIDWSVK